MQDHVLIKRNIFLIPHRVAMDCHENKNQAGGKRYSYRLCRGTIGKYTDSVFVTSTNRRVTEELRCQCAGAEGISAGPTDWSETHIRPAMT
jgi:hypothetical protein